VLAQIEQIQTQVEQATNAYYSANQQLQQIQNDLAVNTRHLHVARSSLTIAQSRAEARLRALYMGGAGGGTVEILLGAQNLDELLNRIDAARRVGRQDATMLRQVRTFRREVRQRQANLTKARATQTEVVKQRAAEKAQIESQLGQQQRLLDSIKDEIAKLQAEEARRQAVLRAQARARYLAALQAQRQQVLQAQMQPASDPGGDPSDVADSIAPAPPSQYGGVVGIALQYLGTPYVWGASGPGAFDCSGFTMFVYAQMGVSLPHNAAAQFGYGVPVSRDDLQPGDLVFFHGLSHEGLYIGNGQFVHAPHTGDVVKISSMYDSWYANGFDGARRIV
jgi:cell wall-associated NlpC family hydrolase